ncbi:hypothetical protein, partial [Zoogloea oryzae]|uniref:hypothetical protein n=1 Tax=Zoogloea oryzae TaxID=310767 RepID=UPI0024E15450
PLEFILGDEKAYKRNSRVLSTQYNYLTSYFYFHLHLVFWSKNNKSLFLFILLCLLILIIVLHTLV